MRTKTMVRNPFTSRIFHRLFPAAVFLAVFWASPALQAEDAPKDLRTHPPFRLLVQQADVIVQGVLGQPADGGHAVTPQLVLKGSAAGLSILLGSGAEKARDLFTGEKLKLYTGDLKPGAAGMWFLCTAKPVKGRTPALVLDYRSSVPGGTVESVLADQKKMGKALSQAPVVVLGRVEDSGAVVITKILKTGQHLESLSVRQMPKIAESMKRKLYTGPLPSEQAAVLCVACYAETNDGSRRMGFVTDVFSSSLLKEAEREIRKREARDIKGCVKRSRVIITAALDLSEVRKGGQGLRRIEFTPDKVIYSKGKIYFPTLFWWPETDRFLSRIPSSGKGIWFLKSSFADRGHMDRGFVLVGFQPMENLEEVKEAIRAARR